MLVEGEDDGLFWSHATDAKNGDPISSRSTRRARSASSWSAARTTIAGACSSCSTRSPCASSSRRGIRTRCGGTSGPTYEATHFGLDVELATALDLTATADLDLVAHGGPRRWLAFCAARRACTLDAVSSAGRTCRVLPGEGQRPWSGCALEPPLEAEQPSTLRMNYHGRCFERDENDRVYNIRDWYPQPDMETRATWDVTVHHPRELQVIGAGERVQHRGTRRPRARHVAHHDRRARGRRSTSGFLRGIRVVDAPYPVTVWSEHPNGARTGARGARRAARRRRQRRPGRARRRTGAALLRPRLGSAARAGRSTRSRRRGWSTWPFPGSSD